MFDSRGDRMGGVCIWKSDRVFIFSLSGVVSPELRPTSCVRAPMMNNLGMPFRAAEMEGCWDDCSVTTLGLSLYI